ncbi:MAG: membrane protein insertase YidC, partial [Candidatus Aminicenantaceae bacterium]
MEKRLLLAIVLSFLVLFLYQALFVKKQPPPVPIPEMVTEVKEKPALPPPTEKAPQTQAPQDPAEAVEFQPVSGEQEDQIFVNTSLYRGVWSNKGGVLKSWQLKEYKDNDGEDLELVSARSEEIEAYPFFLRSDDPGFDRTINSALYNSSSHTLELTNGQSGMLRFEYADDQGTRVEKIMTFQDGLYGFGIQINVWKNGQKIEPDVLWGPSL